MTLSLPPSSNKQWLRQLLLFMLLSPLRMITSFQLKLPHNIIHRSIHLSSSLFLQKSSPSLTGWINSGTLNLQQATNQYEERIKAADAASVTYDDNDTQIKYPSPSSVERVLIRDRLVFLKRDDCLHLPGSNISGNKARKFLSLNNLPAEQFPDAIVSYGGPQSNAMVALAAIVSSKNAELRNGRGSNGGGQMDLKNNNDVVEQDMFRELDVLDDEIQLRRKYGEEDENDANNIGNSKTLSTNNNESADEPQKRFVYYTKPLPRYLRKNPNGNLLRALALGMEIRTLSHDEYSRLFGGLHGGSSLAPADLDPPVPGKSLWVPQGGACGIAKPGSDVLANEIIDYWTLYGKGMPLAVCLPGGTCTTALLLQRSLNAIMDKRRKQNEKAMDIRVVVIPCVGDDEYATRQMISLDKAVGGTGRIEDLPWILKPRTDVEYGSARRRSRGYFTFGQPSKALLETYDEMNSENVSLDLLYGAPAWSLLLQHWRSRESDCPIAGRQLMYIHSGGLEGVASQLTRYKHKNLLPDARAVQTS